MSLTPFEAVVQAHGPMVLRVCRAVLGPVDADDAWSETFLAAMAAYPQLRPDANVEAWLVTIAHRKSIDQLRAGDRRPIPTDEVPERAAREGQGGGWESELWEDLRRLPTRQRQAVAYHHLGGLPYADVAGLVGGSPQAARRAASDGIAALRRAYMSRRPSRAGRGGEP